MVNMLRTILLLLMSALINGQNIGGDGSSEYSPMIYYLIGDKDTYPNLKLLLWNQMEEENKENYGTMRLHG